MERPYEKIYNWEEVSRVIQEIAPDLFKEQKNVGEQTVIDSLPEDNRAYIKSIGIPNSPRDTKEVVEELIENVYPYRMKGNHPRYFCFIPNDVTPYSILGDFINSVYNPYGGGYEISEGTANIEMQTINWMGSQAGYPVKNLGGQFVSGGSMANLTASIIARDDKLKPEDFIKATVYVSDQTHSSVAKGIHIMGISSENVRKVTTDENFRMKTDILRVMIEEDLKDGYKPFLLVGTAGTTNTGSIDPLDDLADIAQEYDMWYHVDGAYGASALISSNRDKLKGIERSDSFSWDGHKWLYQTYGCAAIICKDKNKMLNSFHVNPEYLKDVESSKDKLNFWDLGIELTKPARAIRLWFTLQTVGVDAMASAIDQSSKVAQWIEEEISKYDDFEIVSHAQMGIINFRYYDKEKTEAELDNINRLISQKALEKNYAAFLTTELRGKIVLRFCTTNPLTTREEIKKIIDDIRLWIEELE